MSETSQVPGKAATGAGVKRAHTVGAADSIIIRHAVLRINIYYIIVVCHIIYRHQDGFVPAPVTKHKLVAAKYRS